MTREQFEALASAARPINDDDWGSDRQINAENAWFDAVCLDLDSARIVELEDYALKATTTERIDKARELLFGVEGTTK